MTCWLITADTRSPPYPRSICPAMSWIDGRTSSTGLEDERRSTIRCGGIALGFPPHWPGFCVSPEMDSTGSGMIPRR